MWKPEYMTGIRFIDDQHKHLNKLSSGIRKSAEAKDKNDVFKLLDDFFFYIMFHFEFENKLMQSMEYPMYYDHHMAHSSLLSAVLAAMEESVTDFQSGTEKLTGIFDVLYDKHLKQFDQELSKYQRQSLLQKVEDYYHVANGQLIFFENGYIISAFGEVDENLIAEIIAELTPLIKSHYAHKSDWIVMTDFRRWNYITKGAVDLIQNFVLESEHNKNIQRYYLISNDALSKYLVNQMLGDEMKEETVVYSIFDVLKTQRTQGNRLGKTLKTCNFGNLKNVDLDKYFETERTK